MDAGDRPPSSSGAADDAGVRPPSTSGDAAESDADLAVPARVADFSGVRAWLPRADTRLSRVLGTALRDAGCLAAARGRREPRSRRNVRGGYRAYDPETREARARARARPGRRDPPRDAGEIRSLAEA